MSTPNKVNMAQYHGDTSLKQATVEHSGIGKDVASILAHSPELYRAWKNSEKSGDSNLFLHLIASLPEGSQLKNNVTVYKIDDFWSKLKHPPLSYMGDQFQFRTPDGSFNNVLTPHLGQAGTPYAKSVPGAVAMQAAKPDPGDLFDMLMAREEFCENPKGLSSMILYFASIVIHDIFRTNRFDSNISDTSSYLDLAPLYGSSLNDQIGAVMLDKDGKEIVDEDGVPVRDDTGVRFMKDGKLKQDAFAEKRLFGQPPGVCLLLVMFSRYHNHIAEQLLAINENGRFTIPPNILQGKDAQKLRAALRKRDNDLFNTARLVVGGLYASIAVMDYLRGFMGTHAVDTNWTLDPRQDIGKKYDGQGIPRGIGNQVSVEFNCLYRFHSAISQKDERWTKAFLDGIFGKVDRDTLPIEEYIGTLHKALGKLPPNPGQRVFHGERGQVLERDANGRFNDDELMEVLKAAINDPIGSFGARNVPKQLRVIEILGILQARKWQMCSLNEFRQAFGMEPHTSFEDINADTSIQDALRDLYEHPDMVELYPGIFCEGNGQKMDALTPGCPSSLALWTGVFSDAVTLVRSDRFYTVDWTVTTLTAWGMKEVSPNPKVLKGSCFHKLIQRAFPGWFKYNSIYLWQPMYTPAKNAILAKDQGKIKDLITGEASDPKKPVSPLNLTDLETVSLILDEFETFKNPVFDDLKKVTGEAGKFLRSMETLTDNIVDGKFESAFAHFGGSDQMLLEYFLKTAQAIQEREECRWVPRFCKQENKRINTFQIDVTRDFAVPIVIRFAADFLDLSVSGKTAPPPGISEAGLYKIITDFQHYLNYSPDETTMWSRRAAFLESVGSVVKLLESSGSQNTWFSSIKNAVSSKLWPTWETLNQSKNNHDLRAFGTQVAAKLRASGLSHEESSIVMFLIALDGVYNVVMMFTEILNFFLEAPEGKQVWPDVQRLARSSRTEDFETLKKYVLEAQRITLSIPIVRVAEKDASFPGKTRASKGLSVKKGDKFILHLEQVVNDSKFDISRKETTYIKYGTLKQSALAEQTSMIALSSMIKHVAALNNLRPAHDTQGSLKKVTQVNGQKSYMTADWSEFVPFPATWKLMYDEAGPEYPYDPRRRQNHGSSAVYNPDGPSHTGGSFSNAWTSSEQTAQTSTGE